MMDSSHKYPCYCGLCRRKVILAHGQDPDLKRLVQELKKLPLYVYSWTENTDVALKLHNAIAPGVLQEIRAGKR